MTDAEGRSVDESVEAFRQARIRETRAAPKRDDGALVELARAIGEPCCLVPTSADPSESSAESPDKIGLLQQAVPTPAMEKKTALGPEGESQPRRTDAPRFVPAYRTVSQSVKIDWELAGVAGAKTWRPKGRTLDISRMGVTDDLQRYRSLPGTPAFHPQGFAQFDIGQRFNAKWPEQRAPRRVNDYVKIAVSVGVIAAAIAGFWGGSVIRSGRGEADASLSESKQTSALAAGRAIRFVSTDTVKTGNGSPFGSAPSAFPSKGPGALGRPTAPAIAGAKPDLRDVSAASPDTGQPHHFLNAEVPTPVPAPLAADAATKGSFEPQPVAALAASPPAPTSPLPTNASAATNSPAATSSMPVSSVSVSSGPVSSVPVALDAATASAASKGLGRAAQPVKKHNAIVRFNRRNIAADRTGLHSAAVAPPPRPGVDQHNNDFFLTRFLDNIFRN